MNIFALLNNARLPYRVAGDGGLLIDVPGVDDYCINLTPFGDNLLLFDLGECHAGTCVAKGVFATLSAGLAFCTEQAKIHDAAIESLVL